MGLASWLYASQAPGVYEGSRTGCNSWLIVENNQYNLITIRKHKPGPQNKLYWSGEDGQQVVRQKGVAGGANLLRRSAQEMTEEDDFYISIRGQELIDNQIFT
jgi:hypothetical protein